MPFHLFVFFTSSSSESLKWEHVRCDVFEGQCYNGSRTETPVRGWVKVFPWSGLIKVSPGVRRRPRQRNIWWGLPVTPPSTYFIKLIIYLPSVKILEYFTCAAVFHQVSMFRCWSFTSSLFPIAAHLLALLPLLLPALALLLLRLPVADWFLQESWQGSLSVWLWFLHLTVQVLVTNQLDVKQKVDEKGKGYKQRGM